MSQNLSGLGPTEGKPIEVQWTPPSRIPLLLPWVLLAGLLALRMNHHSHAWLATIPYLLVLAVQTGAGMFLEEANSTGTDMMFSIMKLVTFALTSAWLIMPALVASHRFVGFLKLATTMLAVCGFGFAFEQVTRGADIGAAIVSAGILVVAIALSLTLAGWRCRSGFAWGSLVGWSLGWSIGMAGLAIGTLSAIAELFGSGPALGQLLIAFGITSGLIFGLPLLYLILSMLNTFHGDRVKKWLLVEYTTVPPIPAEEHTAGLVG